MQKVINLSRCLYPQTAFFLPLRPLRYLTEVQTLIGSVTTLLQIVFKRSKTLEISLLLCSNYFFVVVTTSYYKNQMLIDNQ